MIEYENLITAKKRPSLLKDELCEILEEGWQRGDYPPIFIQEKIDWYFSSEEERSWNYHKHCWAMLDKLLTTHSALPEEVDLNIAVRIALDWSLSNVSRSGEQIETVSKFAWYDMAVGLRAQRLAYIIDAARHEDILTEEQDRLLWQSLKAHQKYLSKDENIAFNSNHGYYQAAGQIAMGRRFKDVDSSMYQSMTQGVERFRVILKMQFTTEGVHKEHSPDYHRMVYNTLVSVLNTNLLEDPQILSFTKKIEHSLSKFFYPNQYLVDFGDSQSHSMFMKTKKALRDWQTPQMQYVVTNGKIGIAPDNQLTVFEVSGYFIVRSDLEPNKSSYDTYSYLAQSAAFHSRTHKHADDLSFVWYDRGHKILIDAGRYGYVGKAEMGSELWKQGYWYTHPYRIYCESTRAHNTLEFDGENYTRKGVKPYGSAIKRSKSYENGLTVLETECKHFKSIRRVRVLIFMPGQWLIVYDWFKDNLAHKHDVRQWFNFDPEIQIDNIEDRYSAKVDNNTELYIASLLPNAQASPVLCGVTEPRLQGWHSPAEQEFEPTNSLNYKIVKQNTGSIATLFTFNKIQKINIDKNSVNVSGRRLQIRWSDASGDHDIRLNRDTGIPIQVEYNYVMNEEFFKNINETDSEDYNAYTFNPYEDIGITEQVRLVVYDNIQKEFVHFSVIEPHGSYILPFDELENFCNCKYKYQIGNNEGKKWIDLEGGYKYLIPEVTNEEGLKYAFYPSKEKSEYLIIGFQAIQLKPKYNYIRTLDGVKANRLYIKDCYGIDDKTHSSYYLNENNTIRVDDLVQQLIEKYARKLNIDKEKIILIGSSKGGYAALYHGYKYGVGHIVVGGPQVLLGDYLYGRNDDAVGPPIFKGIFGEMSEANKQYANSLLFNAIQKSQKSYPHVYIHVGEGEPHYMNHVLPLINYATNLGIENIKLDLGKYDAHEELASHYPVFLKNTVNKIINSDI